VAYLYESLNTKHDATQEPVAVEANVENQCHVTKDTSSTGRSNDENQITSSLSAAQSCYEEPQPSTSTSNLFNASSTSLIESASVEQDNPSTSDKCRNEDDVRSMDARNKITQDMLQPKVRRSFSDEEGSSEDLLELSDVDSESSDISQPYIVCRQCPGYRRHPVPALPGTGQETEAGGMQALGEAPSTSANFPAGLPGIQGFDVEEYVKRKSVSSSKRSFYAVSDVMYKLYFSLDYRITGNTVLCYCCGLRSFRELAYQYRQNIPVAELPVTVTSRPDCYWGRNCRTQVKAHHAM
ncbi:hypothetical protein CIB84_001122, partial [Bambusicola thoracicus]